GAGSSTACSRLDLLLALALGSVPPLPPGGDGGRGCLHRDPRGGHPANAGRRRGRHARGSGRCDGADEVDGATRSISTGTPSPWYRGPSQGWRGIHHVSLGSGYLRSVHG